MAGTDRTVDENRTADENDTAGADGGARDSIADRRAGAAMNRGVVVVFVVVMAASAVALPVLGGGFGSADERTDLEEASTVAPSDASAASIAQDDGGVTQRDAAASQQDADVAQEDADAVETGVEDGIGLLQSQGIEVSQEQRAAALEAAESAAAQHQEASAEQVQAATAGAVHGSLAQEQRIDAEQVQSVVGAATDGALAQHQSANATQLQSATWGATHGATAQEQRVTVEQLQFAAYGGAAGGASEAGERDIGHVPTIQEAAQGAAYGVLEQYQKLTAEQRQQVTVEHVQSAATGASAGVLEGTTETALETEQEGAVEQRQQADIKQVQKAAAGAAAGAIDQRQAVTVEQTQAAAHGAGAGPLKQVQSTDVEQVQHISISQIQAASFGAAKGSVTQSQEATVEQIQAAADGAAHGSLVQHQTVSVTQVQHAATGSAKGSLESAIQQQVVDVEQIQAAASGASEGTVTQRQVVDVTQIQSLASGAASGALVQHQSASIEQIQTAARSASQETARVVQSQRISVTQLQTLTQETAADATAYAVSEGVDDEAELVQHVEIDVVQKLETIEELEGTASITFADQESDGESVTVDEVDLSEGGFVAIYDGVAAEVDPADVIGVSDYLEAGDQADLEIDLDEPIEESQPMVAVVHHDTTDDETFQYVETDGVEDEPYVTDGGGPVLDGAFVTLEDEPDDPVAALNVSDQTGDGESLVVDDASASVDYQLTVTDEDGATIGESAPFDANETVENESIALEPPLEDDANLEVAVVETATETTLENETIAYTLEDVQPALPTLEVIDATPIEETSTAEDASPGDDTSTTQETSPTDDASQTDDASPTTAAIEVTFGYDNPNDAPLPVDSEFVEGTTDDEPIDELESGEGEFTVEWTPETDDERLVWQVDMSQYGYDEDAVEPAATATAGEILPDDPDDPASFDVSITTVTETVDQGEPIGVDADIANVGGEEDTQAITLAIDGDERDSTEVTLAPNATESVSLTADTGDLEPGEYPVTVSSANQTAETTVTVAEPDEGAEFVVTDLSGPSTGITGQDVTLIATIANEGDLAESQTVRYTIDDEVVAEETVELAPGEWTMETFSATLPSGESTHAIETDDEQESMTITAQDVPGTDDIPVPDDAEEPADDAAEAGPDEDSPDDEPEEGADDAAGADDGTATEETDDATPPDEANDETSADETGEEGPPETEDGPADPETEADEPPALEETTVVS